MNASDVAFIGNGHKLSVNGGTDDDETLLSLSTHQNINDKVIQMDYIGIRFCLSTDTFSVKAVTDQVVVSFPTIVLPSATELFY